jgi:hypothetical protein
MENKNRATTPRTLPVLRSGDPKTAFRNLSARQILDTLGPPRGLLSSSFKTKKCLSQGVLARILYLTPGIFCSHATAGCLAACLGHSSGRMVMPTHAAARDRRTAFFIERRDLFLQMLAGELCVLQAEAQSLGLRPAARLNGSSDVPWEKLHPSLFDTFPDVTFFDYTKNPRRMFQFLEASNWPDNYHLTFSAAPGNHQDCRNVLAAGGTVAAVFWPDLPTTWCNHRVIDGEAHDARFLDAHGTVVGLLAKGRARFDRTGFTIDAHCLQTAA